MSTPTTTITSAYTMPVNITLNEISHDIQQLRTITLQPNEPFTINGQWIFHDPSAIKDPNLTINPIWTVASDYNAPSGGGGGGGSSMADSLAVDDVGNFWIIRDNGVSLSYISLTTGNSGTPSGAVTPLGKNRQTVTAQYLATIAGTGYSVGDILERTIVLDITVANPTVLASLWLNITTGAILGTAPNTANLNLIDDNVQATITNWPTLQDVAPNVTRGAGNVDANTQRVVLAADGPANTNLSSINTGIGARDDTAATSDTGTFSLISLYKRNLQTSTSMLARLPALYNGRFPINASNFSTTFREPFQSYPGSNWTTVNMVSGDLIQVEGNSGGASYLVISKNPLDNTGVDTVIETNQTFDMPIEASIALHMSQRNNGQEFTVDFTSVETQSDAPAELTISAIQQATTTLTVTTTAPHGLVVGQRIGIYGCVDSRLNYASVVVATTPTTTQFTVTAGPAGALPSVTAGPFASGFVYQRSAMDRRPNGTSLVLENNTVTNASFYVKSENGDPMPVGGTLQGSHSVTINTTASVQPIAAAANYNFRPTTEYRLAQMADRLQWHDVPVDSVAQTTARATVTQVIPSNNVDYKLRLRARNNKGYTVPVAKIVSAVKTGTTTATITTATPHGLTTSDLVNIYGIRDQAAASFPNLTAATAVASIVDATTFTIVIGTASTVTSYGGYVSRVQGGQVQQGALTMAVQSATIANSILTLVGSAAWSGVLIGDFVNPHGLRDATNGADLNLDGIYRVRDIQTTNLILEPIGGTTIPATLVTTNCGGGVIKRTDMRISFVRIFDFERLRIESLNRPANDIAGAMPVNVQNTPNLGTITTVTTVSALTGGGVADGTATTANPVVVGGMTPGGLARRLRVDDAGGVSGPGEILYPAWTFTAGSATPADGTNSRTLLAEPGRDCELFMGISAQGNAANTMQVEGSWDNITFAVIPLQRIDNFAASNQFAQAATFVPQTGATYKGRTYGYPIIRVHQTALTTTGTTVSEVRFVPLPIEVGATISAFTLSAQNTTEAAGTSAGVLMSGGVRTLNVVARDSAKVQLLIDAFTYATAAPTASTIVVEGTNDNTNWVNINLQPLGGGAQLTGGITSVGALNQPLSGIWEGDASGFTRVRARWSAYTAGTATNPFYHGALRIIPVANAGVGNSPKATYRQSIQNATPTAANTPLATIEAGASRTTRIRKLTIWNPGSMTAAQLTNLELIRTTTASTGGATNTPAPQGVGDPAFSGIFRSGAFTAGTTGTSLWVGSVFTPTAVGAATPLVIDFTNNNATKGIEIAPGVANGVMLRALNGAAGGANLSFTFDWTEE